MIFPETSYPTLDEAVCSIKERIEKSIVDGGVEAKNNLIRSQAPICILHDVVKAEFLNYGVNPARIHPAYGQHVGEQKIAGFFKCKYQDVVIFPNHIKPQKEVLSFEGILKGCIDELGFDFTQHCLSVNVRSQLSSTAKNFDTLYERTFAEALNLHLRCQQMVLGEFYMIPVWEYDDSAARNKAVAFKQNKYIHQHIEKYIHSFNALNDRTVVKGEEYKYEKVCLLIVDFKGAYPVIYSFDDQLKATGLLPEKSEASIEKLSFPSFVPSLLHTYEGRFGASRFN